MRIRFLVDQTTREANPKKFLADRVYRLSDPSCWHWINLGVAEEVADDGSYPAAEQPAAHRPASAPRPARRTGQESNGTDGGFAVGAAAVVRSRKGG